MEPHISSTPEPRKISNHLAKAYRNLQQAPMHDLVVNAVSLTKHIKKLLRLAELQKTPSTATEQAALPKGTRHLGMNPKPFTLNPKP